PRSRERVLREAVVHLYVGGLPDAKVRGRSRHGRRALDVPPLAGGWAGAIGQIGPFDLPGLVDLEDVAFLDVVEAFEQDPALEAFGDLADVVLEPLQLRDRRLV